MSVPGGESPFLIKDYYFSTGAERPRSIRPARRVLYPENVVLRWSLGPWVSGRWTVTKARHQSALVTRRTTDRHRHCRDRSCRIGQNFVVAHHTPIATNRSPWLVPRFILEICHTSRQEVLAFKSMSTAER